MKKGKLLSIFTSFAMAGTMIASALPFTASAATNPLGLQLTSEKTAYTMDEIRAGASATVYVDPTGTITESDHVGSVEFKLKSDAWGKVEPIDLKLCDPNGLETKKGGNIKRSHTVDNTASMVISKWEGTKPTKAGYTVQDYAAVGVTEYSADYMPAVLMMSNSENGFFRTGTDTQHIAEFKVNFPTNLAAGKYTISFEDAKSMICPDGQFGSNTAESVATPVTKSITFEIGAAASVTTAATTTQDPDWQPTRVYDGSCKLSIAKKVKGEPGDTVDVPFYLELGNDVDPKYITGIAFTCVFDRSKLELVDIYDAEESGLTDGAFNASTETGNYLYSYSTANIEVDPNYPICVYSFKIKDGATGELPITVTNHLGYKNSPIQVIHKQNRGEETTYLQPTIEDGSILIGSDATTPVVTTTETKPVEVISSIVTQTSIVPVESIVTVTSYVAVESIVPVTSYVAVESIVPVTSYVPVESVVTKESIVTKESFVPVDSIVPVTSYVPVESVSVVTSINPVDSIVPVTSYVPVESVSVVTSINPVESIVPVTSYVPVESIVPVTSYVPVESVSIVTSIDPVVQTSYIVSISEVPVVSVSEKIVTVLVTTTSVSESDTTPAVTSISFSIPAIDDGDSQWYYADETDWHLGDVHVFIDGEEVTDYDPEELIVTLEGAEATPASVYNGKDFDYTLTISFMDAEDTFQAKIGQRGDANCDQKVNVRDAAAIAKDLAGLYKTKKTNLTEENGFGIFLANSDQGIQNPVKTPAYEPYDLNVRDAAVIAKYLANKKANPDKTLKDYVKIATK